MIVTDPAVPINGTLPLFNASFRTWQRDTGSDGLLPIIGISGTRGKSTVLRLLEAMLNDTHLRSATWTDQGVQIRGRRQPGELSGWTHALTRLSEGSLDVALQELDWATVNAVGLPQSSYPVMALTNLRERASSEEYSHSLQSAMRAAQQVVSAVADDGFIVVNADDHYAVNAVADTDATVLYVALSHLSPSLHDHLEDGGTGVWVQQGSVMLGGRHRAIRLCNVRDIPFTMGGEASFNVTNALIAVGLACGLGIDLPCVIRSLRAFRSTWGILPGSMNTYETGEWRAAVDQIGPAWVLRPVLRAINPGASRRQVSVIGDLGAVDAEEVQELGRLLGRFHGAIVLHSEQDERLVELFRHGLASNPYPPLLIRLPTERRAINRAFKALKSGDVLLVLASGDSSAVHRAIRRHIPE
ncbi:MAG TPA: Mur ligase family protein [Thermomicrobiales bacterium]|nr:Mur ligase family protein [Thermomicrobiales bacterium]